MVATLELSESLETETEPVPGCDPETEAEIDDLQAVGISTGQPADAEPVKAAEPTKLTTEQAAADFKAKMQEAANELAESVLERMKAESVYKEAKASEKAAAEILQKIAARGPENYPLWDGQAKTVNDVDREPAKPVADPDGWKLAPLSVLNLKQGLRDRLESNGINTVGRLEQRRADVSEGKEKWPKGVGAAAITQIDDSIVGWLTENQGKWQPAVEQAEAVAEVIPAEPIGDVASRSGQLLKQNPDRDPANEIYQGGREAFGRGFVLADCCWTPGDNQDQWLLGFKDAEIEHREQN